MSKINNSENENKLKQTSIIAKNWQEWLGNIFPQALKARGIMINGKKMIWLKAFHYWLVNKHIKTNRVDRLYRNTKSEYKSLSKYVILARQQDFIPDEHIFDKKNLQELIKGYHFRSKIKLRSVYAHSNIDEIGTPELEEMSNFEDFLKRFRISFNDKVSRFHGDMYHIIVSTEKATMQSVIEPICKKYGADLLIFSGQASYTRIVELVERARVSKRPVLLLAINDLDPAGWDMSTAFIRRVNEIYPNPYNESIRVVLSREQVIEFNIPEAYEPDKEYSDKQRNRFERETGSLAQVELDAMDSKEVAKALEEKILEYTGRKIDIIQNRRLRKKEKRIEDKIMEFDFKKSFEKTYQSLSLAYNDFYERLEEFIVNETDYIIRFNEMSNAFKEYIESKLEAKGNKLI